MVAQRTPDDWLQRTFDLPGPVRLSHVARGAMGEIYRADTPAGCFAVKQLLWDVPDVAGVEAAAAFAQRCRAAGVPSPPPVRTVDGDLIGSDPDCVGWSCTQWVSGRVPEPTDPAAARWLAEQAGVIHRLAVPVEPGATLDPWYRESRLDWSALTERALAAGAPWAADLAARASEFNALGRWASEVPVGELIMCHNDLGVANTMIGPQGWSLLDWDNAGPQEPRRELGGLLMQFWTEPAQLHRLAGAYRDSGGPPLPAQPSTFATGVCTWLNFLFVQAEVLLDPDARESDRDFAIGPVLDLLQAIPARDDLQAASRSLRT